MGLKTIDGKIVHVLDLTVEQRLALVNKMIKIHEKAELLRGRDRSKFLEREVAVLRAEAAAETPEAAEFIERKLRPGGDDPVPLEHPKNPDFFLPHQQGRAPITLREMKVRYEQELARTKEVTDGE